MISRLTAIALLLFLAACGPRGVFSLQRDVDAGQVQQVFIASNRAALIENGVQFTAKRAQKLRFARVDVSIPPTHEEGRIEWPGEATPDAAKHFVLSNAWAIPDLSALLGALDRAQGAQDEVLVFVHGYNTTHPEAIYRLAQIAHDFDPGVPVIAFSWPSGGDPRGYVYDRDSVIHSRDALEDLLLALTPGRKVMVVAHSMGSQLTMEALRQISIGGKGAALRRLSGVALISPDIDTDVFLRQAQRVRPFPQPFVLMTSARDRILDLSAMLTGQPRRLGAITSSEGLEGLPILVVDLTDYAEEDSSGHDTAFTAPAAIELLRSHERQ